MRSRTVRLALKWSFVLNLVLILCVVADAMRNHGQLMVPLLVLYGALLLCVLLLFLTEARAKPMMAADPHPFDQEPVRLAITQRP